MEFANAAFQIYYCYWYGTRRDKLHFYGAVEIAREIKLNQLINYVIIHNII